MKASILVIEDSEAINNLICLNLEAADYKPVSFTDGGEAGAFLNAISGKGQAVPADLALVDIMLPGRDGFSLLPQLRALDVPVIFLTARGDIQSKVKGLKDGAEDYIVKPFEMLELLVRVEKVLECHHPAGSDVLRVRDVELYPKEQVVRKAGKEVPLKPMEFDCLIIVLSKTSFYFDEVAPQDVITLTDTLEIPATAEQKLTTLSFVFEYEDKNAGANSGSEQLFLKISQTAEVTLSGFSIADSIYSMDTVNAEIQVSNTGRAPVYNVTVSLEAPGLFATGSYYAGNPDAGESGTGTIRVYAGDKNMTSISDFSAEAGDNGYGATAGTLTVTWEDAEGSTGSSTQQFSTVITEPQIVELKAATATAETNQWWPLLLVLMTMLFALILFILSMRLRKSRRTVSDMKAALQIGRKDREK